MKEIIICSNAFIHTVIITILKNKKSSLILILYFHLFGVCFLSHFGNKLILQLNSNACVSYIVYLCTTIRFCLPVTSTFAADSFFIYSSSERYYLFFPYIKCMFNAFFFFFFFFFFFWQSTPLHLAAGYNRTQIVKLLLQHRADVHAKDKGYVKLFFLLNFYQCFLLGT